MTGITEFLKKDISFKRKPGAAKAETKAAKPETKAARKHPVPVADSQLKS